MKNTQLLLEETARDMGKKVSYEGATVEAAFEFEFGIPVFNSAQAGFEKIREIFLGGV